MITRHLDDRSRTRCVAGTLLTPRPPIWRLTRCGKPAFSSSGAQRERCWSTPARTNSTSAKSGAFWRRTERANSAALPAVGRPKLLIRAKLRRQPAASGPAWSVFRPTTERTLSWWRKTSARAPAPSDWPRRRRAQAAGHPVRHPQDRAPVRSCLPSQRCSTPIGSLTFRTDFNTKREQACRWAASPPPGPHQGWPDWAGASTPGVSPGYSLGVASALASASTPPAACFRIWYRTIAPNVPSPMPPNSKSPRRSV